MKTEIGKTFCAKAITLRKFCVLSVLLFVILNFYLR